MALSGEREPEAYFTQPVRQIMMMLLVCGLVGTGAYVAYPQVSPLFLSNPWLNGIISAVFLIGVLACFWQLLQLISSVGWIKSFAHRRPGIESIRAPRLLATLDALRRSRGSRIQIGSSSARSLLDSVATRMDESRDITRYIINLLIFLGLLGTFYGLATTVPAVVRTIQSLNLQEGQSTTEVFNKLMSGLEEQLGGMGTAFSSSLLGLAGSLVVGLLELFAGHGQNSFYRELEEWVSTITRLGFASSEGEGGGVDQGAVGEVLDHMTEQMESLQTLFVQSDVSRSVTDEKISNLTDAVGKMTEQLAENAVGAAGATDDGRTGTALGRIADGQERLIAALENQSQQGGEHVDAESRMRLRSIDVQLLRILEEMSAGRQESLTELRADLASLTKTLRQANRDRAERDGVAAGRRRS